jgi:2-oxoglutarate ferredoxin oxidoreductase subunit beta
MAIDVALEEEDVLLDAKDYKSGVKPVWCPGCGDFGVLSATYKALTTLQLKPHEVVVVSGIGCSSRIPYFMRTYGIHGVHGRPLPIATGVKMANPALTVFAMGGDGDLMSIGAGHLPHAAARNVDITVIMMDNQTYGLTKAQASPTSAPGHISKSTPFGAIAKPFKPVMLALAYGATFVARGYSAHAHDLSELIVQGVRHHGFSFIHVQSPCTEFHNTYNLYDELVEEMPPDHDASDLTAALHLALTEERVHLGVFYRDESREPFEQRSREFAPEVKEFNLEEYLGRFA